MLRFTASNVNFYSRPCGRGDLREESQNWKTTKFLLTPLREGRRSADQPWISHRSISTHAPAGGATRVVHTPMLDDNISTHAPAGGATVYRFRSDVGCVAFLLTPLREGRHYRRTNQTAPKDFYSRPCGRGDQQRLHDAVLHRYFYSRPCGRGDLADLRFHQR